MWKISDTRWLNPLAIASVYDMPEQKQIAIGFVTGHADLILHHEDRQTVLAHLARNSTPVVPSDADLSGWPYEEDPTP